MIAFMSMWPYTNIYIRTVLGREQDWRDDMVGKDMWVTLTPLGGWNGMDTTAGGKRVGRIGKGFLLFEEHRL